MDIDWGAFGEVFLVSFGSTVGIVVLYALGVTLLAAGPGGVKAKVDGPRAVAALCFLACAATVAYGLYLIIAKK